MNHTLRSSAGLLVLCMLSLALGASAEEDKYYIGLGLGRSNGYVPNTGELPDGKYGGASVYSFSLGKQFSNRLAFDIEISHRGDFKNNDTSFSTNIGTKEATISISSLSAMLNGYYYYFDKSPSFKPYLTGGVGLSRNKTSNLVVTGNDIDNEPASMVTEGSTTTSFAWKLGAGVKYILGSSFEADFRYQFVNLGDAKMGNSESDYRNGTYVGSEHVVLRPSRLRAHELLVGIVYKF